MKSNLLYLLVFLFATGLNLAAQESDKDLKKAKKHLVQALEYLVSKGDIRAATFMDAIKADFPSDPAFADVLRKTDRMMAEAKASKDEKKKNLVSIKEVITDIPEYVGKEFTVNGKISLSTYFNYGYRGAQSTHYSLRIKDDNLNDINAYVSKTEFGKNLRSQLLKLGDNVSGAYTLKILPARQQRGQIGVFAELIGYGPEIK